uniref:NADH-ubiquinone oxidoreductase chain 3 n=1 Tax=Ptilonyssus chloris TaxID=2652178 RepID=A0A5Q0RZZ8_9ACAR|nr:NADH dehydrogenase subunit 3 [Ptilonyssus chloris]QGA47496.1 NADH dehydrogenase subunit 3 [Ptilonyssus chloris]
MLITMMMLCMLSYMLYIIPMFFNKKLLFMKNKLTLFECGFDMMSNTRIPFSIHFFKICLIFIIFDIEVIMILPIPMMNYSNWMYMWIMYMMIIIFILSLLIEWQQNALSWYK